MLLRCIKKTVCPGPPACPIVGELFPAPGGYPETQAEDHLISPKSLTGLALVYLQTGITGIIQLVGIFQVDILEERRTYTPFNPYIPTPELKTRVILLPEKE